MTHLRTLLLAVLVLGLPWGPAGAADESEEVEGPFPWTMDGDTVFLRRIVDEATGAPLARAVVKLFAEVPHPTPGLGTPTAVGTSGPDGWVRIRRAQLDAKLTATFGEPSWAYAAAEGHGPEAEMNGFLNEEDWLLGPAGEVRVSVHDPLDRPVAGAEVGWLLGCGHTPDVRQAITDADGVAHLPGLGRHGQGWLVKAGHASGYTDGGVWRPWERERVLRAEWGQVFEGLVLDHQGRPAAGVAVGTAGYHRGPWARTDAEGRFRLLGLDAETRAADSVEVSADEYRVGPGGSAPPALSVRLAPPGVVRVIRLPAPGAEWHDAEATARLVVEVTLPEGVEREELPVRVLAVRESDGWTAEEWVGEQGVALFDVPAGCFRVSAQGESHEVPSVRAETRVVVPASGGAYAAVTLPAPRSLVLGFALEVQEAEWLQAGTSTPLDLDSAKRPFRMLLPRDTEACVRVLGNGGSRLVKIPAPPADPTEDLLDVPAPAEVRLTARLLDPEGRPASGWLVDEESLNGKDAPAYPGTPPAGAAGSTPALASAEGVRLNLVAWPEDKTRFQPVRLPSRTLVATQEPLDLGEVRFPPRGPTLRVVGLGAGPLPLLRSVLVTRGPRSQELWSIADDEALFADDWGAPGLLGPDAIVRVESWGQTGANAGAEEWRLAFWARLEGPGPWAVAPPRGSLLLDVATSDGEPLEKPSLRLDGAASEWPAHPARFVGLATGPHEVVIEAQGLSAQRLRFTLAEGQEQRWSPRLRRAPGPR